MDEKRELEFDTKKFMEHVRFHSDESSLRSIGAVIGVSASTLSRIDNGMTPDMETFMSVCAKLNLVPGDYFTWAVWRRVKE